MVILKQTTLEREIQLTETDLKLALVNYINGQFPDLITDEDFNGLSKDLVASFEYDPTK